MNRKNLAGMLIVGLMLVLGVQPVFAAAIVVNSNSDGTPASDGFCTLREAITNANADDQSGSADCAAGSGDDAITFSKNYTITLTGQLPAVTSIMTVTGNGAAKTIIQASPVPGKANYRVLMVSEIGSLTLNSLTIRHGDCSDLCVIEESSQGGGLLSIGVRGIGGGIINYGTLTMNASIISANEAELGGGIANLGTLAVQNGSTISNNSGSYHGGGIYNGGTAVVDASTISANSAPSGGGISNDFRGNVTLNNTIIKNHTVTGSGAGVSNIGILALNASTVTGNSAGENGGGVFNHKSVSGPGAPISGILTIDGSSISANRASMGAGVYNSTGTLTIQNGSVIGGVGKGNSATKSGGGIYNTGFRVTVAGLDLSGTVIVHASVISSNRAVSGGGIYNGYDGILTIQNGSVIGGVGAGNSAVSGSGLYNAADATTATISESCVLANTNIALVNDNPALQLATGNWWGNLSGPGGAGPGTGDKVSTDWDISSWMVQPLVGCGGKPKSLSAAPNGLSAIDLAWADSSADETEFRVERSPDGVTGWVEVAKVSASLSGYQDVGLSCGKVYYYRVRAFRANDGSGQYSGYSGLARAFTPACP